MNIIKALLYVITCKYVYVTICATFYASKTLHVKFFNIYIYIFFNVK